MNTPLLPDPDTSSSTDGRTARRDRGRTAALEAALELFEEANLEPTSPPGPFIDTSRTATHLYAR